MTETTTINDAVRPDEEEPTPGGRRLDPELRSLGAILRMLEDMDDRARARVVGYLNDRYNGG